MEGKLKQNYTSPRWSMEIPDCSMPMSMDTYSRCSYNCLYCFSFFQKSHTTKGYLTGQPRSVNPEKVIALFENAAVNNTAAANKTDVQFFKYIQDRRIMQWGGLADEFDEYERRNGVTLELLRYFDKIDYPLSFSTKAAWWTEDSRYMELFARHTHNWHVKISIITADPEKARKIERGVPSPQERLAAIKRLADIGIHVTLRLRPFIIGCSEDYPTLIRAAKEAGADSVTTEFFCMESRADDRLKARYAAMSEVLGYDIHQFYMENSKQQGYKRLNRAIKAPIIHRMRELTHSLGMRFHVSDAFCRECNDACNCCGAGMGRQPDRQHRERHHHRPREGLSHLLRRDGEHQQVFRLPLGGGLRLQHRQQQGPRPSVRHHDGPMASLQLERHQEGHQPGQSLRRRPCAGREG